MTTTDDSHSDTDPADDVEAPHPTFDESWFITLKKSDISTLDGWQQFVTDRKAYRPPPRYTRNERAQLTAQERYFYDMARRVANVNLRPRETPMTRRVSDELVPSLEANIFSIDPGVRAGMFISADGGVGKSTVMRDIAANFDEQIRGIQSLVPALIPANDRWVPVAWVTVPPKLSIGSLARAILDFYRAPYRDRDLDSVLTRRVEDTVRDCDTRLLVLDDITRYKDNEPDRYASDWIRNLMETSVSIVAMGVDVRGSGILYDGKTDRMQRLRTQTARRFPVIDMPPFSYDSPAEIRHWYKHLRAVEDDLYLLDSEPGMLSDELAEYLFERTEGVIGVLSRWVSITAMKAVGRSATLGGEYLTKADFDAVPVPTIASLKDDIDAGPTPTPPRAAEAHKAASGRGSRSGVKKKRDNSKFQQPPRDRSGAA